MSAEVTIIAPVEQSAEEIARAVTKALTFQLRPFEPRPSLFARLFR